MGPLPKRKVSKSRRNKRRTHDSLNLPPVVWDADAGEYRLSHHVCKKTGMYKGKQVIAAKDE